MSQLTDTATQIRRDILRMVHGVQSGHPGGSLGCADFFTALYFKVMEHNPSFTMDGKNEDIFFLSNGHISPVFYSALARSGYFPITELALVAGIVNLEHDICAEGLDRVEQHSARVNAEIAFALIQHNEMFFQRHRAAGENAGMRGNRERRRLMANLNLVQKRSAGVAADNPLEIHPLELRVQRVRDLVWREINPASPIDADGIGQFQQIALDRLPNLSGRKFRRGRSVVQATHRGAGTQQLFPIGRVGKTGVENKRVRIKLESVSFDASGTMSKHLNPDPGE